MLWEVDIHSWWKPYVVPFMMSLSVYKGDCFSMSREKPLYIGWPENSVQFELPKEVLQAASLVWFRSLFQLIHLNCRTKLNQNQQTSGCQISTLVQPALLRVRGACTHSVQYKIYISHEQGSVYAWFWGNLSFDGSKHVTGSLMTQVNSIAHFQMDK